MKQTKRNIVKCTAWAGLIFVLSIFFLIFFTFNVFAQEYIEYQIKEGDCLWTIARQFQLSIQEVTAVNNNIDEQDILSPGSKINIPQKKMIGSTEDNVDTTIIHTVKKGESLWDIAQQYRLSLDCIYSANNLKKPDSLSIGQKINIPIESSENNKQEAKSTLSYEEEKADILTMNNSLNQEFRDLVKETEYTVKPGETLWTIAHNYQVSLNELSEINDLEDADRLSVGQIIKIPLPDWTKDDKKNKEEVEYNWVEHIVESGESISVIAQKYHVPVETICELNQISEKDYVYPGQRIKINATEYNPTKNLIVEEAKTADKNNIQENNIIQEDYKSSFYTVKAGDTLWSIAKKYGVSMEGILAVNYLSDKDVLKVGQNLEIPAMGGSNQGSNKVQTVNYTVVKGDSLWNISEKFDIKMHEIININQLENVTQLSVGQKLKIPATEKVLAANQETTASPAANEKEEKPKEVIHYIQKGESLWAISRKYQVSISTITAANRISESGKLVVGQKLLIPNVRNSAISSRSFMWPLNGLITSQFGMRTLGGRRDYHTGIDIDGRTGDPIRAAENGKVSFSGFLNGYGYTVIIDHSGGYSTVYSHNSSNLVSVGQSINKGDIIAKIGSTGYSTGSHLHFEIREDGKPMNPINYLP